MPEATKRKQGPREEDGSRSKKKSKAAWRSAAKQQVYGAQLHRRGLPEIGEKGLWVTYARGMDRMALGEFCRLCDKMGEEMYGIVPPQDEDDAPSGDEGDGAEDIEASIEKELAGFKTKQPREQKKNEVFQAFRPGIECVFFLRVQEPVQPVDLTLKICRDAKACADVMSRKTKYINRLSPVTAIEKASEKGVRRACRKALAPYFTLKRDDEAEEGDDDGAAGEKVPEVGDEGPAYSYAIRPSIRNNSEIKRDTLIPQVASLIGDRHKVNLDKPDKVILVDVTTSICGVGVVDGSDWDDLKRFNVNEIHKATISSGGVSSAKKDEDGAAKTDAS